MEEAHALMTGMVAGISSECLQTIQRIRDNEIMINNQFVLQPRDAEKFTNNLWKFLGRYIANNTYLEKFDLDGCQLTDEKMTLLFGELVRSHSLQILLLNTNEFGIVGVRKMVPLLRQANLSKLFMCNNANINTECFGVLISALDGKSIEVLDFSGCNIEDISALDRYNLPYLRRLELNQTNIGREGIISISNLLQREDTRLEALYLDNTVIDDEDAEFIAASLEHNNKLEVLYLGNNNDITERGYRALLKVLVDVSSIESTYNSNYTLARCYIGDNTKSLSLINSACKVNQIWTTPEASGRAKVICYHLNSQIMEILCEIQDIEYINGNIFADIEPVLLSKILALIGSSHGQSELYTALVHTAPELLSYIDKKAMLNDTLAKNTAHANALNEEKAAFLAKYEREMACLTAHNTDIHRRLELVELGDTKQDERDKGVRSNKRQRI